MSEPYIVTPPDGLPVSLEQAKAQCHIDDSYTAEDDVLTRLIKAAWNYTETFQARTLLTTTYAQKYDYFPYEFRVNPKLQSVSSITYIDSSGDTITLDSDLYEFDEHAKPGVIYPEFNMCWPSTRGGRNDVTLTWVAGYDDDEVPESTQSGILQIVAHWFKHREAVLQGGFAEVPMQAKSLLAIECWGSYR
ncbi:hypothetical protein C5Y96_09835 [Blastopirellula marina]|uniref:Phage gp6-like head-tail connector protein n=1 Tax=Blastopirellula marina TaxID=124 RepID=A0A2S8FMA2_9BACT|nr:MULTISPECIES: head-tail connector protein [Pirellulaceae]PQO33150.1 hypothetical protein C5Y96_09835 [Blastopirellula marina]RCS52239.1 hypothetical protein DTL36_09845 [Bremerella cremea]